MCADIYPFQFSDKEIVPHLSRGVATLCFTLSLRESSVSEERLTELILPSLRLDRK